MDTHDHSMASHSAKCDEEECLYVATTHAHDNEEALGSLAYDLSMHNKEVHQKDTVPEDIKEGVKAKMQTLVN